MKATAKFKRVRLPTGASETVTCNVCGKTLGRNDLRGQRICRRHYHLSNRNPQQYMAEVRAWKKLALWEQERLEEIWLTHSERKRAEKEDGRYDL